jgi:hypothetical protein
MRTCAAAEAEVKTAVVAAEAEVSAMSAVVAPELRLRGECCVAAGTFFTYVRAFSPRLLFPRRLPGFTFSESSIRVINSSLRSAPVLSFFFIIQERPREPAVALWTGRRADCGKLLAAWPGTHTADVSRLRAGPGQDTAASTKV